MRWLLPWVLAAAAASAPERPAPTVSDLAWLAGSWSGTEGKVKTEEHWTPPAAGTMLAVGRTISGDKTVFIEYLRIETREDGLYYVAMPGAKTPTDFKLKRLAEGEVEFENPQHDYPQRILYRRNPDGSLTARIEGDAAGKKGPQELRYQRVKP